MTCAIIAKSLVNTGFINEYEPPYSKIKEELRDTIWKLFCEGYTDFYSNCEYGVSLWAAEIVIALKMYNDIKLHIIMPYEEQATKWSEEYRDRYFAVHEKADSVELLFCRFYEDCYKDADKEMVSRSDRAVILDMYEVNE